MLPRKDVLVSNNGTEPSSVYWCWKPGADATEVMCTAAVDNTTLSAGSANLVKFIAGGSVLYYSLDPSNTACHPTSDNGRFWDPNRGCICADGYKSDDGKNCVVAN